jgi:hypothetical protein
MANLDTLFRVDDGISIDDSVGIFTGGLDPSLSGFESPVGSLYLNQNTGSLYIKTNVLDTNWEKLISSAAPLNSSYITVSSDGNLPNERILTGTANQISITDGGPNNNITLSIDNNYPGQTSITTLGTITTGTWNATTISTSKGGTGLTTIGTANQILGVNTSGTGLEYKTLVAGTNITITPSAGSLTISASGGGSGSPASPVNSVQFNNAGAFGGTSNLLWDNTNNRLDILGADQTQRLRIGGSDDPSTAAVYIQVNGNAISEGQRVYFKRNSPGINGWITYHYDGSTPNIRLTDEDDDPPYIQFNVIGSGTYAAPLYSNTFGGRGPTAGATTGFSWKVNGTEIASIDTNFFQQPSGTTANRPATPVAGMTRYNTTLECEEVYSASNWVRNIGIIDKSVVDTVITTAGPNSMFSFNVPGGTLGTDRILRFKSAGRWSNASGANRTVTIAISYGGTTLYSDISAALATGSTTGWNIEFELIANNSTTSQKLIGVIMIGSTGAVTTGVTGDIATDEITSNAMIVGNNGSINSATNQTLDVSVTFNGAGITWTKHYHTLELL